MKKKDALLRCRRTGETCTVPTRRFVSMGEPNTKSDIAYFDGPVINRIDTVDAQTDADQHKHSPSTP